jgi:hypothetical protein
MREDRDLSQLGAFSRNRAPASFSALDRSNTDSAKNTPNSMGIIVAPSPQRPPKSSIRLALPVLVMVRGCAWGRGQVAAVWRSTGAIMGNVVYDFLLFSCMALFVTGIVLAAASLLI